MEHSFATAGTTVLAPERATVFFDGMFTEPKLSHPEGVAIGPDGWIWCGNQDGDILRVRPDGCRMERVATTGGFTLGLAFDADRALFVCDLKHKAVFSLDLAARRLELFSQPGILIPNYPVIDRRHRRLLVSDSHAADNAGPGVWAYDLATGEGELWFDRPLHFANGMAMRRGEPAIYVCETFARRITRIGIDETGNAREPVPFAVDLPGLPDGVAFDRKGRLVVGCYEPSRLLRITEDGGSVDVLIEDPTAHTLCHPTNIAFDGTSLYTANLGRWHLTKVAMDVGSPPLWTMP